MRHQETGVPQFLLWESERNHLIDLEHDYNVLLDTSDQDMTNLYKNIFQSGDPCSTYKTCLV